MDDDSPYDISVANESGKDPIDESELRRAVEATLRRHDVGLACVSVALVDDNRIAELNQRYLHHTGPTDVLSFNLSDTTAARLDGEVVVSVETALRNAPLHGNSPEHELLLYVVHGVLHLLHFDDQTPTGADRMHAEENAVLEALGHGPAFKPDAK